MPRSRLGESGIHGHQAASGQSSFIGEKREIFCQGVMGTECVRPGTVRQTIGPLLLRIQTVSPSLSRVTRRQGEL